LGDWWRREGSFPPEAGKGGYRPPFEPPGERIGNCKGTKAQGGGCAAERQGRTAVGRGLRQQSYRSNEREYLGPVDSAAG